LYLNAILTNYKFLLRVLKENLEYLDYQELTEHRDTPETLECRVLREILALQDLRDL
jgi:hypothetical protein